MGTHVQVIDINDATAICMKLAPKLRKWCKSQFEECDVDYILQDALDDFVDNHDYSRKFDSDAHRDNSVYKYLKFKCGNAAGDYSHSKRRKSKTEPEYYDYAFGIPHADNYAFISFEDSVSSEYYCGEVDVALSYNHDLDEFIERDEQYRILRDAISTFGEQAQIVFRSLMNGDSKVDAAKKAGVTAKTVWKWNNKLKQTIIEAAMVNKYVELPEEVLTGIAEAEAKQQAKNQARQQAMQSAEKPVHILVPAEVPVVVEAPAQTPFVISPSITQTPGYAEYQQAQLNLFFGLDDSVPFADDVAVLNQKKRTRKKSASKSARPVHPKLSFDAPVISADVPHVTAEVPSGTVAASTESPTPTAAISPVAVPQSASSSTRAMSVAMSAIPCYSDYRDRQLVEFYRHTYSHHRNQLASPRTTHPPRSKLPQLPLAGLPPPRGMPCTFCRSGPHSKWQTVKVERPRPYLL